MLERALLGNLPVNELAFERLFDLVLGWLRSDEVLTRPLVCPLEGGAVWC